MAFFDVQAGTWGEELEGELNWCGSFSPDGKWLAYISHATGEFEAHVRSFPDGNVDRQVSDGGAIEVVWCPSGELIYRTGDRWMSVPIRTEPALDWDAPQLAFETDFVDTLGRSFDVSSDGQRLYVVKNPTPPDGSRVRLVSAIERP